MPTNRNRRLRGVTLVELMVTLAITSVLMIGISSAFIAQGKSYQGQASRRAAQASGRVGLSFLEERLRLAGFGMDPDRAIIAFDSFNPSTASQDTGGYPDGIAIHYRQLNFRRGIVSGSASATGVTLDAPPTQPLLMGQILLLQCGSGERAYVVVGSTTSTATVTFRNSTVPADLPTGAPGALFSQHANITGALQTCLNSGSASVLKISRQAFFVAAYTKAGVLDLSAPNATPYLMLHTGRDENGDSRIAINDATPVAEGTEQLQLAYIMNSNTATMPTINGVSGAMTFGEAWNTSTGPRWEDDSYLAGTRLLNHPANIRQVRVSLVVRGTNVLADYPGDNANTPPATSADVETIGSVDIWRQLENLPDNPAVLNPNGGSHLRSVLRVSVAPKNLLVRSPFLPVALGGG